MSTSRTVHVLLFLTAAVLGLVAPVGAAGDFVNFESGHTRPLALSPDGSLLFAVNTPDDRLSVFTVGTGMLTLAAEVPAGLEPVAVAARANGTTGRVEAWVVNHLSDSVSIVEIDPLDVTRSRVTHTLLVGDEPRDVVFAGTGTAKAFVTTARRGQNLPASLSTRFLLPGVGRALVWVFDAEAPGGGIGGTPATILELFGDSPRALAASPDGSTVYASIFHSGNATTIIRGNTVSANGGPPPLPPDSPFFDEQSSFTSLIVQHDPSTGRWNDVANRDWAPFVRFNLPDADVFVIDADADPPALASGIDRYARVGTTLFNMAVRPGTGSVFVTNSDARSQIRFEPLQAGGVQGHVTDERITILDGIATQPVLVNPHIDHGVATGPPAEIDESLAILTDVAFSSDGATLYAAALGSDRVAVFDAAALEAGSVVRDLVTVGRGPSGVALDEARDQLYVLNHFDHTISIVSDAASPTRTETAVVALGYDPTPLAVRNGRPFLYDARHTSGHGDTACASCHVFGDFDGLTWDLGDPYGSFVDNPNPVVDHLNPDAPPPPLPFSPLKGPMATQSLRGLAPAGPMHWRGDRTAAGDPGGDYRDTDGAFKKFNPAFVSLMGRSAPLTTPEMQAFTDFVLTIQYPPNPVRALDGTLNTSEAEGLDMFTNVINSGLNSPCIGCHALPLGTDLLTALQTFKVPHYRNLYEKVGMFGEGNQAFQGDQIRGFGYLHDGATTTLLRFVQSFGFGIEDAAKIVAFLLSFDTGLHPAVGQQITIAGASVAPSVQARLDLLRARDEAGDCDLVFAGNVAGEARTGAVVSEGAVRLDRSGDPLLDADTLAALAADPDGEQTYTCHPPGTGNRAALDRDGDGVANGDEVDVGTNPDDATSVPFTCTTGAVEGLTRVKLTISKNDAPAGDEGIALKTQWTLAPGAPALDPLHQGLNLLFRDTGGRIILHRRIAGISVDKGPGWTVNKAGTKWTYRAKAGATSGGIIKASVSRGPDGTVNVQVKGKGSDFRIADTTGLVVEIVVGGDDEAAAGLCATRTFGAVEAPVCATKPKLLKCG